MKRDALVVGINTYKDTDKKLTSPAANAEAIAQVLEQAKFRVKRLPKSKKEDRLCVSTKRLVYRNELHEAIEQLFLPPKENIPQTALLLFSGHGLREDFGFSQGYLATSDANPKLGLFGVSLLWLRELLNRSPVKEQLVWLDCCYSGELLNFQKELYEAKLDPQESYSRCFIAASREDEKALGNVTSPYGELTHALLQGLDPANTPNGWVTSEILTKAVNRFLTTGEQHPIAYNFGTPIILTTGRERRSSKDVCPYKGLEYFTQEDANLFHGRTALTDELLEKVDKSNFLALVGASGSGKSSVLRAGLLHKLSLGQQISGSHTWQLYEPFTPGEHPLQSLETVIERKADELEVLIAEATMGRVVITVDQFEECFTLCQDKKERQQFFDFLLNAVARLGKKLCFLLGIRADFLGKCLEYPQLGKYISKSLISVAPMTKEELEEAIIEPAKQVDLQVEKSLVNRLLEDVQNSPGSLPLLEYTLAEIWKARKEAAKDWLTLASYNQLGGEKGGIKGILENRANEVYEGLLLTEEKPVAKYIFLSLTQLNENAEDTRKRKRIADLVTPRYPKPLINQVVQKLTHERLIVTHNQEQGNSNLNQEALVDVVHEALIRNWELLRTWITENEKFLLQQKDIEDAANNWRKQEYHPDFLFQGSRLYQAEDFKKEHQETSPLSVLASEFIQKGIDRRQINKLKTIGWISLLPLIALIFWGYRQVVINKNLAILKDETSTSDEQKIEAINTLIWWRAALEKAPIKKVRGLNTVDFSNANLASADLKEADLKGAILEGANLDGAKLKWVNLEGANLRKANLGVADISRTNLTKADLEEAQLDDEINMWGANLYQTNFQKAKYPSIRKVKGACNWEDAIFDEKFKQELEEQPDRDDIPENNCEKSFTYSLVIHTIGAINRAQKAYHTEIGQFSNSLEDLGISLDPQHFNVVISEADNQKTIVIVSLKEKYFIDNYSPSHSLSMMKQYSRSFAVAVSYSDSDAQYIDKRCISIEPSKEIATPIFDVDRQSFQCAPGSQKFR